MLTIEVLLANIGRGQSGIPTRIIFQHLDNVYTQLAGGIIVQAVKAVNVSTTIFLKIPSADQKKTGFYYDVDFWFDSKQKITQQTHFKVYSNSPGFGYNYAYLFHQQGSLLFPEKYPRIMTTQAPKVRNPYAVIGFDKHVYCGLKYLFKQDLGSLAIQYEGKVPMIDDFESKQSHLHKLHEMLKK